MTLPDTLPAPYNRAPSPGGVQPQPETVQLVKGQISALLAQAPSFYALSPADQDRLHGQLTRISSYTAELVRDAWAQSKKLGQTPVVRRETTYRPDTDAKPVARTQAANNLQTNATGRVADITQSTLRAIAFPTFVADLINGTFDAIIGATIKQMRAFMDLVEQVSKNLQEFERDNITDNNARDWLVQAFPDLLTLTTEGDTPTLQPTDAGTSAEAATLAPIQSQLGLSEPVSSLDEETIEQRLVPAARRKLAQNRLEMLSTMVMMGLQRIVIRHGRLRATMGFHIDASDRAHAEEASSFDVSHSNTVSGFFYVAFSARTSVAYVSSQKSDSDSAINVQADLTGEVDLTFETDYLPLNRLARAESIERIRGNTPNPEANHPNVSAGMTARGDTGPSSGTVVQDAMTAHRAEPAPTIPANLISAAGGGAGGVVGAIAGGG